MSTQAVRDDLIMFELALDHDLFDVSRYEGYYPALYRVCQRLIEAGEGATKIDGGVGRTTPSEFAAYIAENKPSAVR